jgi:hypothetical protein
MPIAYRNHTSAFAASKAPTLAFFSSTPRRAQPTCSFLAQIKTNFPSQAQIFEALHPLPLMNDQVRNENYSKTPLQSDLNHVPTTVAAC